MVDPSRYRPRLFLLALFFAVVGQWTLLNTSHLFASGVLWVVALTALMLAKPQDDTSSSSSQNIVVQPTIPSPRWLLLGTAALGSLGAFVLNMDTSFKVGSAIEPQFTPAGVLAWLAGIVCFLAAFWQPEKNAAEWRAVIRSRWHALQNGLTLCWRGTTLALMAILLVGAFFYLYRLDTLPAEMTSDHAEKLLDVNDILEGYSPVFFLRNTGREPLQFYLTAALIRLTGLPLSHLALKLGTALIGFLTIPATFLLAREMFDSTTAICAAFFVAVLHWPVSIARMGLRYPFTPFFAAISFYFVMRALKHQKRNDFLMAGFWLGLGLYGYIPSRNVPLAVLGLSVLWMIVSRRRIQNWRSFLLHLGLMFALTFVVFIPLLRYTLDFPEMFWYRALTRVTSIEVPVQGSILSLLAQNLVNLALAFNWRGDEVWTTNIPYAPTLDEISGALLILGIAIAFYRWADQRQTMYLYLLVMFIVLLMPSALSLAFPRENPSLVRMGGAIPFTAILLALPVAFFLRTIYQQAGVVWSMIGLGLLLAPVILLNYRWYFIEYDQSYRQAAQNSTEVAAVLRSFANSVGDRQHAYFIGYPHWIDGRAIAIHLGDISWKNFTLDARDFFVNDTTNLLFILHPDDTVNLQHLQERYPQGQLRMVRSRTPGKDFLSFFVPAVMEE